MSLGYISNQTQWKILDPMWTYVTALNVINHCCHFKAKTLRPTATTVVLKTWRFWVHYYFKTAGPHILHAAKEGYAKCGHSKDTDVKFGVWVQPEEKGLPEKRLHCGRWRYLDFFSERMCGCEGEWALEWKRLPLSQLQVVFLWVSYEIALSLQSPWTAVVALLISDSSVYSVKEQIRNVQWTSHWCFFLSPLSAAPRLHRLSLHGDRFALSTTPCLPIVPHLNNSDGAVAKVYGSLKKTQNNEKRI